ncbi:MAG: aspartate aminotransferase family protein [Victivallales bacterium]|nr:aspartate aminotransferase family protein [Victivallales bacterium]
MDFTEEQIRSLYRDHMIPAFNFSMPIMVRASGSELWDIQGKRYLDFTMGISVCNLGHCHPRVTQAIAEQAATLMHCSNVFCNINGPRLAKELADASFGGKVFFANSGAEANEGMIKTARLWGTANGGRHEIVCFRSSFHGRTLATLAATRQPKFREGMDPEMPGFREAVFNDLDSVRAAITDQTCAILVEPVQGEGGVFPATVPFLVGLRKLCDEKNLLLLLDEVQTGMGRTGAMFAYQHYPMTPDAISLAKSMGNGIPLAAFEVRKDLADLFQPGITHGSTFGGNPLATAAGLAVMEAFREEKVLENVRKMSQYLQERLQFLHARHSVIRDIRGLGLLLGIEVGDCVADIVKECREKGLLVLTAGKGVLRLLPSLKVTSGEIDEAIAILNQALEKV